MTRSATVHICQACGASALRWAGRCSGCGEWNTLVERPRPERRPAQPVGARYVGAQAPGPAATLLSAVNPNACVPVPTGIDEVDRVLSGGLVPGSVTLVGGEPGIGKSTLLLQTAASAAQRGCRTLLVAAEESAEQVSRRAARLGAMVGDCYIVSTSDLATALEAAGSIAPDLLIVDSIQTVGDPGISSGAGSTSQVRACAQALAHFAKATGTTTVLVGHVTKEGALAGPRTLEHLVDTVLSFDGDRHHALRHLSATKHRFGTTGEVGLFEMTERGLVALADPSAVLLADRRSGVPGSIVCPVIDGRRPILVEVQALVAESRTSTPRRVVQGVQGARLALLLAVLERSVQVSLSAHDVFVSTVGGIRVTEPATDLAVALALVSAVSGKPIPETVVGFGEVGLGGELRQTAGSARRLSEAARLGFERAILPTSAGLPGGTMGAVQVATIAEAVSALGLGDPRRVVKRRDGARRTTARAAPSSTDAGTAPGAVRAARAGLTVVRD